MLLTLTPLPLAGWVASESSTMADDPCSKGLDLSREELRAGSRKSKTSNRDAFAAGKAAQGALPPLTVSQPGRVQPSWQAAPAAARPAAMRHTLVHIKHNRNCSGSAEGATGMAPSPSASLPQGANMPAHRHRLQGPFLCTVCKQVQGGDAWRLRLAGRQRGWAW